MAKNKHFLHALRTDSCTVIFNALSVLQKLLSHYLGITGAKPLSWAFSYQASGMPGEITKPWKLVELAEPKIYMLIWNQFKLWVARALSVSQLKFISMKIVQ